MKLMSRRAGVLLALCLAFLLGIGLFLYRYVGEAPRWATYPVNRHLFQQGRLREGGDILDRDGIVLSSFQEGRRVYNPDSGVRKGTLHLVGDRDGNIAVSIQASLRRRLTGWSYVSGAYARGSRRAPVTTTVDAGLCRTVLNAMGDFHGAVGVMNWKTGEILCMVSTPAFDPENPPDIAKNPAKYEGVYLNRMLQSTYTPGSIFKMVTAAAALDTLPNISGRQFECSGSLELEGGVITCPKNHGTQSMEQIFSNSCNTAFAALALELGQDRLTEWAERAGLNRTMELSGIPVVAGAFSLADASAGDVGWAGVGQYTTLVNPMAWLQFTGAVANGGVRVKPQLLQSTFSDSDGRAMSRKTAEGLKALMGYAVENNYGALGMEGRGLCAKSGTAQVGADKKPHAWFTGFLAEGDAPLAFIVIVENGGAGSSTAAKVAAKVLAHAVTLK